MFLCVHIGAPATVSTPMCIGVCVCMCLAITFASLKHWNMPRLMSGYINDRNMCWFHFVAPVMILTLLNHTNCNFKRIKAILHREEAFSGRIFIKFALQFFFLLVRAVIVFCCCCCCCILLMLYRPLFHLIFFDYISIELNFRTVFGPCSLINLFGDFFRYCCRWRRRCSF